MKISPEGFAALNLQYDTNSSKVGAVSKQELDEINNLISKTDFYELNNSYPVKQGAYDFCYISLTLQNDKSVKTVSWSSGISADDSTPKGLLDLENYLEKIQTDITNNS